MKRPLLVLGATGLIGRNIVAATVEAGLPVIAVARDSDKLAALKAAFPGADVSVIANTIRDDLAGDRLARELRDSGRPLAGVVASICGSPGRGRLLDQPVSSLGRELDEVLIPHLSAARHVLPFMAENAMAGNYILIGGPGSEMPWAGYGPRSVTGAALRMLAQVLHDEARALGIRVQLLDISSPACTDQNLAHACPRWPRVEDIGRRALQLALRNESRLGTHPVVPFDPRPESGASLATAPANPAIAPAGRIQAPILTDPRTTRVSDARRLLDSLIPTKSNEVSR